MTVMIAPTTAPTVMMIAPSARSTRTTAPLALAGGAVICAGNGHVNGLGILRCDFDDLIRLKQCWHCFTLALIAELLTRIIQRHMDVGPELADHGSALARLIDAE